MNTPQLHPSSSDDHQTRFFYVSGELRRSAGWAIAGGLLLAPVSWYVFAHVQQRGIHEQIIAVVLLLLVALWFSQYLLPRVRIDDRGVSRRILWTWDLWSWEEFASGTLQGGFSANEFISSARPWWRRTLSLGYLEQEDQTAIGGWIRRVWTPPHIEAIPETLSLRLSWPDSRTLRLSGNELEIGRRQNHQTYGWSDVISLTIWRVEPGRPDFRELELILPDQKVQLLRHRTKEGVEAKNWSSCSSEVVAAAFTLYIGAERVRDFALSGPTRSLGELDARHARQMVKQTESQQALKWCSRGMWGIVLLMPLLMPWPGGMVMCLLTAPLALAIQWMQNDIKRSALKLQQSFEAERATYPDQNSQQLEPPLI